MEKRTPHCKLPIVKTLIVDGRYRMTQSAKIGAAAMGLDVAEMLAIIVALEATDFYKSMTTHADHTIWQDVYRPSTPVGDVYLKLTVVDDLLVVSFKEL
ncbi:type II toxin-antitoxin system MqsR family toxin [Iodobacter arcticus]|uniref:Type II toxin-antitoxin system MqsR family toxin n=1 Tax=Iodobacter arcticus TaxID=590593 RepID=A0ABW2R349_9NEIS